MDGWLCCVARHGVCTWSRVLYCCAIFIVILLLIGVLLPLGNNGVRIGEAARPGPMIHSFDNPDGIADLTRFDGAALDFDQAAATAVLGRIVGGDDELSPTEVLRPLVNSLILTSVSMVCS